jgi:hypothetical protein
MSAAPLKTRRRGSASAPATPKADEATDHNILTRADVAPSGKVNQALIVGVRIDARIVDLSERHAGGCVGHNVRGVGTGREGHEERGVFAAGREREGAEPREGTGQRAGVYGAVGLCGWLGWYPTDLCHAH